MSDYAQRLDALKKAKYPDLSDDMNMHDITDGVSWMADRIEELEARDKNVREEALREAYQNLRTFAPHEDHTTGPEHDIGYAVGYRTAMNRLLDLIKGDNDE